MTQKIKKISHSTSTSTSSGFTVMSDVQAGDLLMFYDNYHISDNSKDITRTTPSGFTNIQAIKTYYNFNYDENVLAVSYKIANGTESGTTINGTSQTAASWKIARKTLILFRLFKPISTVTVGGLVWEGVSPVAQTITSSVSTTPNIIVACYSKVDGGSPPDHYYNANITYSNETPDEEIIHQHNSIINSDGTDYFLGMTSGFYYTIKNRGTSDVDIGITTPLTPDRTRGCTMIGFYLELE
jgi:hypothetical protein